jgi:peptidyl-prolyl cis-trans isomerase A (cyclophilin A)
MKIMAFMLPAMLGAAAFPLLAQEAAAPPATPAPMPAPAAVPKPETVKVSLVTSEGPILLELEKERAPITTKNFLRYVDAKRFDNAVFYRAVGKVGVPGNIDYGLAQGGVQYNPKKLFPPIAHEPTTKTGLSHTDGAISMARLAPGTASGDWFITIGPMTSMDANPAASGDNLGYAVFGHVISGLDVVKKIIAAPRSPTLGEGVMKGQMLSPPIKIISARRISDATPTPATHP